MRIRVVIVCLAAGIGLHAQSRTVRETLETVRQLFIEGDFAGSLELAARTLRTEASRLTPADSGSLLWLLASIHQLRGEFDDAAIRYRASIWELEKAGTEMALPLARVRLDYASLLVARGAFPEAERLEAAGLAAYEAAYGPDQPDLLFARARTAFRLRQQGQYGPAEALCRDIITRWETAELPRDLDLARLYDLLANVLLLKGEALKAAHWYERSILIVETLAPHGHPFLLDPLVGRAAALIQIREFSGAAELLARAETITLTKLGNEHPMMGVILKAKCDFLRSSGRKADAKREERRLRTWIREFAKEPSSVSWAEWTKDGRP